MAAGVETPRSKTTEIAHEKMTVDRLMSEIPDSRTNRHKVSPVRFKSQYAGRLVVNDPQMQLEFIGVEFFGDESVCLQFSDVKNCVFAAHSLDAISNGTVLIEGIDINRQLFGDCCS